MEGLMRRLVLGVLIVLAVAVPARAQVRIDIGIQLPGPPALVVIPGAPVYYAPRAPANVFFYGDQYWLFHGNGWYAGSTWNGPWVVVEPVYLPAPILRVPVRYYHVRPPHWRGWHHDGPPRWDGHWGREWREASHERDWREREERWHHDKHKGRKHDERHDRSKRGRGHDK
jgi:hypothetical protein